MDIYSAKQWEEKHKSSSNDAQETEPVSSKADATPSDEDSKEEEDQEE